MKKKTTTPDIMFEKKHTKSGEIYFQGVGDHEQIFVFKEKSKYPKDREIWRMTFRKIFL